MKVVGSKFLDPQILAGLPNIEFVARKLVEGAFVGYHKSPQFGYSVEFVDHRDYHPGDDLRTVDWRVWARKDKFYVKRFEMETQLKATIIVDRSRSMDFGTGPLTKLHYSSILAASLAYTIVHQNDMAGLVTFDDKIHDFIPPRGSRSHMRTILHALGSITPGPVTNIAKTCHHLADTIKSRGMIVLISDLLDDVDAVLHGLRHFQHKKHDVIVFHVLDDAEMELPFDEVANFRDIESGKRLAVDPAAFRKQYKERLATYLTSLREGCRRTNIDYNLVRTSEPIEKVLGEYIAFRARRSK